MSARPAIARRGSFFFSSRRRHTRCSRDWSSDVCSSDLAESPVGGRMWAGIVHNLRSPYLLGICAYMLLYSITSTVLYFQQVGIAASAFTDRSARTAFFAEIDMLVNVLSVLTQAFLTGR